MDWETENWIRLYKRNTPKWLQVSPVSRWFFWEILRHADRNGSIALGDSGLKSLCVPVCAPWKIIAPLLKELLDDGCIQVRSDQSVLFIPNFALAQSAVWEPAHRAKRARQKAKEESRSPKMATRSSEPKPTQMPFPAMDEQPSSGPVSTRGKRSKKAAPSIPSGGSKCDDKIPAQDERGSIWGVQETKPEIGNLECAAESLIEKTFGSAFLPTTYDADAPLLSDPDLREMVGGVIVHVSVTPRDETVTPRDETVTPRDETLAKMRDR